MLKLVVFLMGLLTGGAGVGGWLLSAPGPETSSSASTPSLEAWQMRVNNLKQRFRVAISEGQREGGQTEESLRRKLDACRRGSVDSAAS
jgi:hypothetical protein